MFSVSRFAISAVILGTAGLAAWGLTLLREAPTKRDQAKADFIVEAKPIVRYTGMIDMELTGLVVPFREIQISAQASGRVIKKAEEFEAGKYVSDSTTLLQIDPTDYELEITRLEADLAATNSSIEELEVELEGARQLMKIAEEDSEVQLAEFERKRNSSGFSRSEIDQARRAVLAAETTVTNQANRADLLEKSRERLLSTRKLKQAQLEKAQIERSRCLVQAPCDGVVVNEDVELGSYVSVGTQLLTFEDTSKAEISCNLRPDQLEWLWNHTVDATSETRVNSPYRVPQVAVRIFHDTEQGQVEWTGRLDRYDGIGVDEQTKTIPCIITVDNPIAPSPTGPRALVRGMFVNLKIELPTEPLQEKNRYYAKIPSQGLRAGNFVWIVRNNQLVKQVVKVVDTIANTTDTTSEDSENRAIIIELAGEGIQDTDRVVTTPVGDVPDDRDLLVLAPGETVDAQGKVTLTSQSDDRESTAEEAAKEPASEKTRSPAKSEDQTSDKTSSRRAAASAPGRQSDRSGS